MPNLPPSNMAAVFRARLQNRQRCFACLHRIALFYAFVTMLLSGATMTLAATFLLP